MLDPVQLKVKNKLGINYSQVNGYKIIYNFISRFAFCQVNSNNINRKDITLYDIKLEHDGMRRDIPTETRKILEKIGTEKLYLYFSPHEYPKKFENFCTKMLEKRAKLSEYYTQGLLCTEKRDMIEVTYES